MKKFLYLYFGGNAPKSQEDGQKIMQAWMSYFGKMGEKIVDGGAPLGPTKAVGGTGSTNPRGYSVINAETLEQAIALTDGHPHLMAGGTIEVCETQPIPM